MDKASDFGSEDCEFDSRRGRPLFLPIFLKIVHSIVGQIQNLCYVKNTHNGLKRTLFNWIKQDTLRDVSRKVLCPLPSANIQQAKDTLTVCFCVQRNFEKQDFLENSRIVSCFELKSVLLKFLCVFIFFFFQDSGSQLCFRVLGHVSYVVYANAVKENISHNYSSNNNNDN